MIALFYDHNVLQNSVIRNECHHSNSDAYIFRKRERAKHIHVRLINSHSVTSRGTPYHTHTRFSGCLPYWTTLTSLFIRPGITGVYWIVADLEQIQQNAEWPWLCGLSRAIGCRAIQRFHGVNNHNDACSNSKIEGSHD